MVVLGINGGEKREEECDSNRTFRHDAAAALIRDGQIVAAVEEERLNRIKHTNSFPAHSVEYCLNAANLKLRDVDRIAVNSGSRFIENDFVRMCLMDTRRPLVRYPVDAIGSLFERDFGVDVRSKIAFCHHHYAHAWSAYALSGFSDAAVVSIDGWGDDSCGMAFRASEGKLEPMCRYGDSLGMMYSAIIRLLGFSDFDEYKAMGLAPYGDRKTFRSLFEEGYRLLPDGKYEFINPGEWLSHFLKTGVRFLPRREHEDFVDVHWDLAAALQHTLEEIVLHVLKHLASENGAQNLCLSGGVAHNCTLNGRILESGLFRRVFVQPAAHDAGGALGAAYSVVFNEDPRARVIEMPHVFLGPHIGSDAQIQSVLNQWSDVVYYESADNIVETAATLLSEGKVIGWINGQSEFGPRALGNRSILADPRPPENKSRINTMIKKRESFRPFAPSVIEERIMEFFEVPSTRADLSFMTYSLRVRKEMRERLGAVTHVDGTARVQAVSAASNKEYWRLLNAFGRITGVPVLLNTSFNNNVEPIVDSLEDALTCFLTTGLDYLVVGNYLIRRKQPLGTLCKIESFVPTLPRFCRLQKLHKFRNLAEGVSIAFAITRIKRGLSPVVGPGDYGSAEEREITEAAFRLLAKADGTRSIADLLYSVDPFSRDNLTAQVTELFQLWTERLVCLRPPKPRSIGTLTHERQFSTRPISS